MPKGAYTQKQERKADHIAEGYRKEGVSKNEAEERPSRGGGGGFSRGGGGGGDRGGRGGRGGGDRRNRW